MMQSLEKIIFDMNDGLHIAGVIADDKYITQESFIFSLIVAVILLPSVMRAIESIPESISNHRYFSFIIPISIIFLLYMMEAYFAILIVILMARFINIIFNYPKYYQIREFLERWL